MTNIRYGWKSLRLGRNAVHINKQYNFEMFPLQNVQPTSLEGHDSRLSVQNVYVAVNSGRRRLRPSRRGLYSAQALYIVYLYRGLQYTVYRPRVYYILIQGPGFHNDQLKTPTTDNKTCTPHQILCLPSPIPKIYSADDVSHSISWKEKHFVKEGGFENMY